MSATVLRRLAGAATLLVAAAMAPSMPVKAASSNAQDQHLLFQTNWKKGLHGWVGSLNWNVVNGYLQGGFKGGVLLAPYRTGKLKDFAVEARIKGLSVKGGRFRGWGVVVRNSAAPLSPTGIDGGFYSEAARIIDGGTGLLFPDFTNSVFDPGIGWHVYRLEVHGQSYRLIIDGAGPYASGSTDLYLGQDHVGLQANQGVQVSVFKVYALP